MTRNDLSKLSTEELKKLAASLPNVAPPSTDHLLVRAGRSIGNWTSASSRGFIDGFKDGWQREGMIRQLSK